ncbi:MAG TPA: response regulator [Phototrophicaceae bacterium]|jgi:two-component system cell cycle response regulator DivK|nr:response regulator [Phototrophicaceae bacterium]
MPHALIIDDNVRNVTVLVGLLEMEGLTSTRVTHPNQLNAALVGLTQLDVVFLDLEMPGQNGYEVLAQLKAMPQLQTVPVVAYTVHVSEVQVAHDQGFDGFLGKPINPDKFPGQLARILNGERVWESF